MERSHGQHHLAAIFLLLLLAAACIAAAEAQCKAPDPCDPNFLAWIIGGSCVGDMEHPSEQCCEGVVAAVGMGFGDVVEVPCLCRVAKHRYLAIVGIDIHTILRLYPICDGVLPVGPQTAEACQGRG